MDKMKSVTVEYDGKPLSDIVSTARIDYHAAPEDPLQNWIKEVTVPLQGTITPEGESMLDRLHWDAWMRDVMAVIDAGEVIPACAHVLNMLRFCVSVQLSDYGADTAKRVINAFYVKYGLEQRENGE